MCIKHLGRNTMHVWPFILLASHRSIHKNVQAQYVARCAHAHMRIPTTFQNCQLQVYQQAELAVQKRLGVHVRYSKFCLT